MKTFAEYLTESKHTYDYRIKIAGELPPGFVAGFKDKLKQFDVVSMSDIKKTPVQKQLKDFPQVNNDSMSFVDVTFNYPATPPQITQIAQALGLNPNMILIQDKKYADSVDSERAKQDAESKNLLTDTDYPAPDREQKALSKDYATGPYDHAVVKNAYKSDFTVAGGKTPPAVSTNDFPMGDKSPVGTTKNKLPAVHSNAR